MMSELFVIDLANWLTPDMKSMLMMHRNRPAAMSTMRVSHRLMSAQIVRMMTTTPIQERMVICPPRRFLSASIFASKSAVDRKKLHDGSGVEMLFPL